MRSSSIWTISISCILSVYTTNSCCSTLIWVKLTNGFTYWIMKIKTKNKKWNIEITKSFKHYNLLYFSPLLLNVINFKMITSPLLHPLLVTHTFSTKQMKTKVVDHLTKKKIISIHIENKTNVQNQKNNYLQFYYFWY